jgi:hypothetical protein
MKRARKAPDIPLTQLRIADLKRVPANLAERRAVNLKVPVDIVRRVQQLAQRLGVTQTAAIIALLNEGLQAAERYGVLDCNKR